MYGDFGVCKKKEHLKISKIEGLVGKCYKIKCYNKHFCANFSSKLATFIARNINIYEIRKLQGYIFLIL